MIDILEAKPRISTSQSGTPLAEVLKHSSETFACITSSKWAVLEACLSAASDGGKAALMAASLWSSCNEALRKNEIESLDFRLSSLIAILRDDLHDPRAGIHAFKEFDCVEFTGYSPAQEELSKCFAALGNPTTLDSISLVEFGEDLLKKAS